MDREHDNPPDVPAPDPPTGNGAAPSTSLEQPTTATVDGVDAYSAQPRAPASGTDSAPVKYAKGHHPNTKATQWKPGQSGNPLGTQGPKVTPHMHKFADMTRQEIEQAIANGLPWNEEQAASLLLDALDYGSARHSSGQDSRSKVLQILDGVSAGKSSSAGDTYIAHQQQLVYYIRGVDQEPALPQPKQLDEPQPKHET